MSDLARSTGLGVAYVRQVVSGTQVIWPARRKIEAALSEKFWEENHR
jgi:hypothetical protein